MSHCSHVCVCICLCTCSTLQSCVCNTLSTLQSCVCSTLSSLQSCVCSTLSTLQSCVCSTLSTLQSCVCTTLSTLQFDCSVHSLSHYFVLSSLFYILALFTDHFTVPLLLLFVYCSPLCSLMIYIYSQIYNFFCSHFCTWTVHKATSSVHIPSTQSLHRDHRPTELHFVARDAMKGATTDIMHAAHSSSD